MIKQITIKNFQSHKDTTLDLDPGVNIIGGTSDSGKTALLRALKWVITNRPSGDSYRSHWGGDTEVGIITTDDVEVFRRRTRKLNGYDMGGETFVALGAEVPEPVKAALNINPLSWQSQMDAPFLLSETSGEVSRVLNEVADLEKIDVALFNINKAVRDNKGALVLVKLSASKQEQDLQQFENVDAQKKRVLLLKEMARKAALMEQLVEKGSTLLTDFESLSASLAKLRDVDSLEPVLKKLQEQSTELETLERRMNTCNIRLEEHARLSESLSKFKNLDGAVKDIDKLLKRDQDLQQMLTGISTIEEGYRRIQDCTKALADCKQTLANLEETWRIDFPSTCPLCGQEVHNG